jgi:hypothetical protein
MGIQKIFLGTTTGDKTGDGAKTAGQKINANFDYLEAKIDNVDKLVSETGFSLVDQNLTMNAGWQWLINGIPYTNPVAVVISIPFAATGKERIDLIVLNTSNTFTRIPGTESVSNPVAQPVPNDTVQATLVVVTDGVIEQPTAPVTGDAYVAKSECGFTKLTGSGAKAQFSIFNEMTNVRVISASSIASVSISDKKYIYPGKDHYVKNETGTTLIIKHNSGTGNYKYLFPNATDLVIQNNEIVHFKFRFDTGNNGFLDYVGGASSGGYAAPVVIADVTGLTAELADRYTKSEVDAKVASVYVFKGNIANYAALPSSGQTIGWTYNLNDTGANYAWTGTVWDKLGDTIDISGKEDTSNKTATVTGNEASTSLYLNILGAVTYFQQKLTDSIFGTFINSLTAKPTPIDADSISIVDTADGNKQKKVSLTNFKAYLLTWLNGLFGIKAVRQISSATTLADSDNGLVIILTASCTVTIPNGLVANFECTLVTLAGATLTIAQGGSVALLNNAGTTMAEKLSCTIKNTLTTNQYLTVGNL